MEESTITGWERFKNFWLGPVDTYSEPTPQQQGSVDSAGGTSPLIGVIPPPRSTASVIGVRDALTIIPVARAVGLIANGVSQLPLSVQKRGRDLPVPLVVAKPDLYRTQTEFLSMTAGHLATYGNAFWRLHRDVESPAEPVTRIEILNPELVVKGYEAGRIVYRYGALTFAGWQVKHLMINPQFEVGSTLVSGVGPIQAHGRELAAMFKLNAYLADYYDNNGIPQGILTTDNDYISPEIADQMRARWMEVQASAGIQIVPNGFKFQQVQVDPEKAMYHASAQKMSVDTAVMFGMPDRFLLAAVDGSSMTYTNDTAVNKFFVQYTLSAYLTAIEDAFTDLLPRGQRAKFNVDAVLRLFTADRYATYQIGLSAGFLTVNEVRALEDLPPIATPKPPVAPNPEEGDTPEN